MHHLLDGRLREDRDAVVGLLAVEGDVVAGLLEALPGEELVHAPWSPGGRPRRGQPLEELEDAGHAGAEELTFQLTMSTEEVS